MEGYCERLLAPFGFLALIAALLCWGFAGSGMKMLADVSAIASVLFWLGFLIAAGVSIWPSLRKRR